MGSACTVAGMLIVSPLFSGLMRLLGPVTDHDIAFVAARIRPVVSRWVASAVRHPAHVDAEHGGPGVDVDRP